MRRLRKRTPCSTLYTLCNNKNCWTRSSRLILRLTFHILNLPASIQSRLISTGQFNSEKHVLLRSVHFWLRYWLWFPGRSACRVNASCHSPVPLAFCWLLRSYCHLLVPVLDTCLQQTQAANGKVKWPCRYVAFHFRLWENCLPKLNC